MMTVKQLCTLQGILASIRFGYGWVGESMMQIYADDENLNWKDVEAFMDASYDTYNVCGEKIWDVAGNLDEDKLKKIEGEF